MACGVLHGSGGLILKDVRCRKNNLFNASPTVRARTFQDTCPVISQKRISQKASKFQMVKSTNEAAITITEGGVFDIEDEATFERYLKEAENKLVVLDISTKTCGPCKMIYPKLVKLSKEYPDALFLRINGDLNSDTRALMRKWGIRAVPAFRFFRQGELIHSHNGANEDELRTNFLVHYA